MLEKVGCKLELVESKAKSQVLKMQSHLLLFSKFLQPKSSHFDRNSHDLKFSVWIKDFATQVSLMF